MSFSSFGLVIPSRRVVEDGVDVVEEEGSSISGGGGGRSSSNDTGGSSPCSRVDASGGHDNESHSSEDSNKPSPSLRWDVYTSAAHPGFEAEVGVYTSAPTLDDMLGFNNTGNVCVWPSEEVGLPSVSSCPW